MTEEIREQGDVTEQAELDEQAKFGGDVAPEEKAKPPQRRWLDIDVYEAAKQRIRYVLATHDHLFVSFSGGKDSLVTLKLVEEVYREDGIDKKIGVFFLDEEIIPDAVLDFVQSMRELPQYDFHYLAVPLRSHKFILGRTFDYIQWDPNRKWIRPKPEFAIKGDGTILSQYEATSYFTRNLKGKVAVLLGLRASESLYRYRAVIAKRAENYISVDGKTSVVKPIYDWSEKDIFKYLHDKQIRYCSIYDSQIWNGDQLRVSTPLHAESAQKFAKLRTLAPVFYQQVVELFPEMLVQERYWKQIDRYAVMNKYPHTFEGIIQYVRDTFTDPGQKRLAISRVRSAQQTRKRRLARGEDRGNLGGFPVRYVFAKVIGGGYKRTMLASGPCSREDFEFEGLPVPEGIS